MMILTGNVMLNMILITSSESRAVSSLLPALVTLAAVELASVEFSQPKYIMYRVKNNSQYYNHYLLSYFPL